MTTEHHRANMNRPPLVLVTYSGLGDLIMSLPLVATLRAHFTVLPVVQAHHRELAQLLVEDGLLDDYLLIEHNLSFRRDPIGHFAIYRALSDLRPEVVLIYGKRVLALAAYLGWLPAARTLFADPMGFALPTTATFEALAPTGNRVADYLRFAEKLGIPAAPRRVTFSAAARERLARAGRPNSDPAPYAVVAPWASTRFRAAPPRFFRRCIEIIATEGRLPVVVIGTAQDRSAAAELTRGLERHAVENLVGATGLREMLGLLAGARFLLTNDSGSWHAAQLVGTPSLIAFGPTTPGMIFPAGSETADVPIRLRLPCSPCEFSSHRYRCPGPFLQCLNDLDPDRVRSALLDACHRREVRNP